MSTLLTIDFDIIMSPSIEIYNNLIGEEFKGIEDFYLHNIKYYVIIKEKG